jgi:hypothetical protein
MYICIRGKDIASVYMIFQLHFGTVQTVVIKMTAVFLSKCTCNFKISTYIKGTTY